LLLQHIAGNVLQLSCRLWLVDQVPKHVRNSILVRNNVRRHLLDVNRRGRFWRWECQFIVFEPQHSSYSYPYFFLGLSVYQGPNYSNSKSATWKADTRVSTRSFKGDAADCMTMNVIGFTTEDGEIFFFEVPRDKTFEEVEEFLKSGRSEGLKRVTV